MLYLSGKITASTPEEQRKNLDDMNRKAAELRAQGFELFNPAELEQGGFSWEDYLARDVLWIIKNRPNFYFMRGWETSRGSRLEHALAKLLELPVEYE